MSDPTSISIRDVRFVYRPPGLVALDGLSVEITAGSVVAVVGQNGAGKTTLAKLLNGLLRPALGSVIVDGLDTAKHPVQVLARHVGFVFQHPNHQLFARTVGDELAFGPRNLGCTTDEVAERVAEAVDEYGLADLLDRHPYRLSFPLRKLVSIASVVTMCPRVLVLDEPTTGQDHQTGDMIARRIQALRESGTTVVCVTHDMPLVAAVADRVLVLAAGRLVADGTPRAVFSDRASMAAAHLVPPQIARLSLEMPGRVGRPAALSVAELASELGPRLARKPTPDDAARQGPT